MTTYGVTATGFVLKTYAEIKEDFLDAVEAGLGPEARQAFADSRTAANKLLVVQERIADLWELAQSVHNSMDPDTATDASLDRVVALTGTTRRPAASSSVWAVLTGAVGTTIPVGSKVATSTVGDQFETTAAITLSATVAVTAYIDLNGAAASGAYTVTINGTAFSYAATVPPDDETVILGTNLAASITAGAEPVSATYTGGQLVVTGDTDPDTGLPEPFSVTVTANLQVVEVGNLQEMESVDTGAVVALAGTLTDIVSGVGGWSEATNPLDATVGRAVETDAALRLRRAQSLANPGSGTVDAIRAAVLEVSGVTAAFVLENATSATVDTIPPHAFEVVVLGGLVADIGQAIWDHKPAGIYSHGQVAPAGGTVVVTDDQGFQQTVRYTRPTSVLMWVRFTVTEDTELGTLPTDYEDLMAAAVATWGASEGIGHDAVPAQIAAYVMGQVPGIRTLVTEVVDNAGHPGSYQTTPWTIDARELAVYAAARVEFV